MKKKLSLMKLEKQQLDEKQLLNVLGGSGVNWCDCSLFEDGTTDSVAVWHDTPNPNDPKPYDPVWAGAQQPGVNWCDSPFGYNTTQSTPPPC